MLVAAGGHAGLVRYQYRFELERPVSLRPQAVKRGQQSGIALAKTRAGRRQILRDHRVHPGQRFARPGARAHHGGEQPSGQSSCSTAVTVVPAAGPLGIAAGRVGRWRNRFCLADGLGHRCHSE